MAKDQAQLSTAVRRKPTLSIRARLLLLALLTVAPLMLDRIRLHEAARAGRIESAHKDVPVVARVRAALVARYGGEEFAVLMRDADTETAITLSMRLRAAIEDLKLVHAAAPAGYVTISIGVAALVPTAGESAGILLEAADAALYGAKRRGRNAVVAHAPVMHLPAA